MKHLMLILSNLYPNRLFSLSESYHQDEVYNVEVNYSLSIEDSCDVQFKTYSELEKYVFGLEDEINVRKSRYGTK